MGAAMVQVAGGWATGAAVLLLAVPGIGQVRAPRYQSPIEAPKPQLTLPTPAPVSSPDATVVEDVIVRVNDQIIDRSDVERNLAQLREAEAQGKLDPEQFAQAQKDMIRDMIDEQLLLSRGKELEINADPEVIRELDEILKQNKLDSMEDLEKAVRQSGISYEDFKADIKNRTIRQQVVRDEVGRTLRRPTLKEEQAYYDAHKQEFDQPEQVRLSEILVPTPDNATDAQVAQAQAKAADIAAQLKAGAKFEDLAKKYSGGQTADKGGDLGLFKRGVLAKVLEDQTFPLAAGESTAPIRTRQGFVVLKVTERVAAGAPPLKDVEDQVQEGLFNEEMQPALRKYLTDLREKAYIDIAPGFVDSGASAKETKPVYAAATPPPVKKKVEQKQRLVTGRAVATGSAPAAGAAAPVVAGSAAVGGTASAVNAATAVSAPPAKPMKVSANGKKPKKIHKEKIRFGQAPRNSLPAGPEETLAAGADQGAGATSSVLPSAGTAVSPLESTETPTSNLASNADPLAPVAAERKKTRFSDRAPVEAKLKAESKAQKVKAKAAETPTPLTTQEALTQKAQDAPLGLGGDTATKKKKKKVKGAPKERMQDQPPAPPAPKPEATPIPPKSVRENGEPVVDPPPANAPATTPVPPPQ
jgi:peptidyl-prolyl cis-trans isomerase SurA